MALYLPPSGPVFDPPGIVQSAPEWALRGPLAALMADYAPPRALTCIFDELSTDHRPAVKQAIVQQILLGMGGTAATAYVNSVQQVSITIASGSTSNTATITAVGALAYIVGQGENPSQSSTSSYKSIFSSVTLTNSTTVTASRNSSNTDSVVIKCAVVDATSLLVSSVQFGTVTLASATSNTATISSVTTSLSAVFLLGFTTSQTAYSKGKCDIVLTNATTVTATAAASSSLVASFCVVQFQNAAIKSIQSVRSTFTTTTNAANTTTITSVTTANTMLAWGGMSTSSNSPILLETTAVLTNSTTLTFTRGSASSATFTVAVTVIEFNSGVMSVQRSTITLNNVTSNTATITLVTTTKTVVSNLGFDIAASAPNNFEMSVVLTDATTVTGSVNAASAVNFIVSFEAVSFN